MAKTKEGCLLGQGEKARSDDSALSSKQKTEKVSIVFEWKKKLSMAEWFKRYTENNESSN